MHFASFDLDDPIFEIAGLRFSLQVIARENVYGLDRARTSARAELDGFVVRAAGLRAAGGQLEVPGTAIVRVQAHGPGRLRFEVRVKTHEGDPVRCVKILLRDLDVPLVLVEEHGERAVGGFGEILAYPNRLPMPALTLRAGETQIGLRTEDDRVRETRFALATERIGPLAGRGVVEWVLEQEAFRLSRELAAPGLVVSRGLSREEVETAHLRHAEHALGLVPFETRADVPAWARGVSCVLALHGMHWTGRVFLDYAAMRDVLAFAAQHVDPRRVLLYLPGWEGRYYWQYGEWRPEPRLGGDGGFARLLDDARARGAHVMPMFGGNCVNAWLPRFRDLDPRAYMKSATGNRFHGNQPDWDFSRAHDTGWQAWLNPGHPGFRDDLASQIESLARRFGFDAVFLDTIHVWINDPDHAVFPGIRALVERLCAAIPNLLVAAEHDYDALCGVFPFFQRAYWGRDAGYAARYARRFGHLCEGEPEGRTGVHELGTWTTPAASHPWEPAPGYLPTISFQDDTLGRHRDAIAAALDRIAAAG